MRGSESPPPEQLGRLLHRGRCRHVDCDGLNAVPASAAHPPIIFTSCSQDVASDRMNATTSASAVTLNPHAALAHQPRFYAAAEM